MDFQAWIENVEGMAAVYSFDILPDGTNSEIRLMTVNRQNTGVLKMNPDAPAFYPGIPWRCYFTDINFESYLYQCGIRNDPLYSYANAHGFWLKGFYLPMHVEEPPKADGSRTVYILYVGTMSPQMESDSMSQHSPEVSSAVMNISIKLHQTQDYTQAMAATVEELNKLCGTDKCALYTVDHNQQSCEAITENGLVPQVLAVLTEKLGRKPYENALQWEADLADSDCLLLDDLQVLEERDPVWYHSLQERGVRTLILYAIRSNQVLVGFIWAVNFDNSNMVQIKETLELTSFLIGAVIANHQFVSRLELMSTIDRLTQVSNRNALDARTEALMSGKAPLPAQMGVVFADLNGLKTVNDVKGHDAGDKLLTRAAALLKLVFTEDEIYRAGGDEFVMLCPGISEQGLEELVNQLRAMTETMPEVSFAVGSLWLSGEYDLERALQTADERMYQDKAEFYRNHPEKAKRSVK